MSQLPSAQKVATTSSARPSSSACAYAAIAPSTPARTSAYVVLLRIDTAVGRESEADVDDRPLERIHIDLAQRREQLVVAEAAEEAVDRAVEVGDVPFHLLGQAHVLEAPRV